MTESQLSICTWADATFGPASDASIAARALVEMAELVTACVNNEPAERIGEEIADVVIALARLGRSVGEDVLAASHTGALTSYDPLCLAAEAGAHLYAVIATAGRDGRAPAWRVECIAGALGRMAYRLAIHLPAFIDRKMAINRTRRWPSTATGTGST